MTTRPLPSVIQAAQVFTAGDPAAGIPGASATVRSDGALLDLDALTPEDRAQAVADFRAAVAAAFALAWGERPTVVFDFEQPTD